MLRSRLQKNTHKSTLHVFVFENSVVRHAVFLLLFAFLLQPIAPVFASEEAADSDGEVVEDVTAIEEDPVEEIEEEVEIDNEEEEVFESELEEIDDVSESDADELVKIEDDAELDDVKVANEDEAPQDAEEVNESDESEGADVRTASTTDLTISTNEVEVIATSTASEEVDGVDATTSGGNDSVTSASSTEQADENSSSTPAVGSSDEEALEEEDGSEQENVDDMSEEIGQEAEKEDPAPENIASEEERATSTNNATSSDKVAATSTIVNVISTVINDSNRYQFGVDECTSVGDGTFYCSGTEDAPELIEDGVFSVPDEDGDMEIMIRLDGVEQFITKNEIDDAAPYYDANSDRIVWHSLKNDRYQVVSYDLDTAETTYMTNEHYNNMEPVAHGDITLWQAWIGDGWEIMMHDGADVHQLTDNDMHDVAPHMRGDFVMWQTQFADGWQVAMYDFESQSIEYIGEGDGSKVENPRFVLVYDSVDVNGDVATMGYDFESKKSVPLSQVPASLPEKLPESDSTGETRALIQNKSNVRESEVEELTPVSSSNGSSTPATAASTTQPMAIPEGTLDLTASTTQIAGTTTPDVEVVIPDLDLSTTSISSEVAQEERMDIPDVVIPPSASSTSEQTG